MRDAAFSRWLTGVITEIAEKVVERRIRTPSHRHGEVTEVVGGRVKVKWDGEATATGALYPCLDSYTSPAVGHRVYATPSGTTWIVHGKIRTS